MALKSHSEYILGLDVGTARIGMALAHNQAKLPSPYGILQNNDQALAELAEIIDSERVGVVVVGLPRDAEGQETAQSKYSREFAKRLQEQAYMEVKFADESLSSVRAEDSPYRPKKTSTKHLDDIAACYILEEFFGKC